MYAPLGGAAALAMLALLWSVARARSALGALGALALGLGLLVDARRKWALRHVPALPFPLTLPLLGNMHVIVFARRLQFLRFVTACPNTPLLGFSQLAPSFCVHRAGMGGGSEAPEASADTDRLPTAATCMNMLKLPPYASEETAREKLLLAIHSESGFDLS